MLFNVLSFLSDKLLTEGNTVATLHEHHGRMWAESKEGRNTFFVELPVS